MSDMTDNVNKNLSKKELAEIERRIAEGVTKHQAANKATPSKGVGSAKA